LGDLNKGNTSMGENALCFAVVGAGYWGKNLIRNFATTARSNLKYVCDLDEKQLAIQKKNFPFIETTTDLEKVLSDSEIEAVVIDTWSRKALPKT